ncbi:MAG: YqgE/AlgH family protein [Pseudomonadota bacterium]
MRSIRRPLILAAFFVGILLVIAVAVSGRASGNVMGPAGSVKGKFLVANPSIKDPRFSRTLILMVRHSEDGAFGLIVNRPGGIAEIAVDAGNPDSEELRLPAFYGGPVEPERAFVIHSPDYSADDTIAVSSSVSVTATTDIMDAIAGGKGPEEYLYVFGYSGWGPGQLENELRRGDWSEAPLDPKLIFSDDEGETVWKRAREMRLRGI